MFDNTRKYLLTVNEIISHGISAKTTTYECSILENFTVDECEYSQITKEELKQLNEPEYINRVSDYLKYLNVEESTQRNKLIDNASYHDEYCNIKCDLNSDFLVYKFFDDIRVVDIGYVYGEAQYRAYPIEEESSGYTWQSNATFTNLDLDKVYVFEVRDYFEDDEYCKVQKTVSLSTLVQSTTFTPEEKIVYLNQKTCDSSGVAYYNNGFIEVDPSLKDNEIICVDYKLFAYADGDASSCARLYCKTNNENSFSIHCLHTDSDSFNDDTIVLHAGDTICYNLITNVPTAGSCGCAHIEINSVNGGGTTLPLIDESRYCEERNAKIDKVEVEVTLNDIETTYPSDNEIKRTGLVNFSPSIPEGNEIELELTGLADIDPNLMGTNASIKFKCKPNGSDVYDTILTHIHKYPQPLSENINVEYGDDICYELEVKAVEGSVSTACFNIVDTIDSNGVISSIGSPNDTCIEKVVLPDISTTVSICNQETDTDTTNYCETANGFINLDPNIPENSVNNQCVKILFNSDLEILSSNGDLTNKASAEIFCRKCGNQDFVKVCTMSLTNDSSDSSSCTASVEVCGGDKLCYCLCSNANSSGASVNACLGLNDVIGYNGVTAEINDIESKTFDCVTIKRGFSS